MDGAAHFSPVGSVAAASLRVVGAVEFDDFAALVPNHVHTGDKVAITEPDFPSGSEAVILLWRILHKVAALDIKFAREGNLSRSGAFIFGVVDCLERFGFSFRIVDEDDLQRVENRHAARGAFVEILADVIFQQAHVHDAVVSRDADAVAEFPNGFGGVASAAKPGKGGHARVVPAADVAALDEFDEPPFAEDGVGQVEPRKFDLARVVDIEFVEEPVVKRTVILKFQRADGVRDAFNGIRLPVREIVHGVDAPFRAGARMLRVEDSVHHGVAEIQIGRCHVNFRAEHFCAVGEFARAHTLEEVEVFFHGAVSVGTFFSGFRERASVFADFFRAQVVYIGFARFDELHCPLI